LQSLEAISQKAANADDLDERRMILPRRSEINYLEKLVKKIKLLRRKLNQEEQKGAEDITKLSHQALAAYQRGLREIMGPIKKKSKKGKKVPRSAND